MASRSRSRSAPRSSSPRRAPARAHRRTSSSRGDRVRSAWKALAAVLAIGLVAGGTVLVLNLVNPGHRPTGRCTATAGGSSYALDAGQTANAARIAMMTADRNMPPRAATIGIATAMQESKLSNIDYGDRDSIGLFQQRPSQGWGTHDEIMDPVYSTGRFLDALAQIDGYQEMNVTEAAQAVQKSGFPEAYGDHEQMARTFASALSGYSGTALTCDLDPAEQTADPRVLADELGRQTPERDLVSAEMTARDDDDEAAATSGTDLGDSEVGATVLELRGGDEHATMAAANWAVAEAADHGVVAVRVGDAVWQRTETGWAAADDTGSAALDGGVRVIFAAAS